MGQFVVVGEILEVELMATGRKIRQLSRLTRRYGKGRWRKLKGRGTIRLKDGTVREAELHWYEAAGIGKKELKIKRYLS